MYVPAKLINAAAIAAVATTMLISGQTATAQTTSITFQGVVGATGYDTTGVFGPPQTDLFGASYSASFLLDLSLGDRVVTPYLDQLIGGPQVSLSMPLVEGSITINGVTAQFPVNGHIVAQAATINETLGGLTFMVEFYEPPFRQDIFYLSIASPGLTPTLSSNSVITSVTGGGNFQLRTDAPSQNGFQQFALGQLSVASVEMIHSAVPEPSSFGMLAVGLLLVAIGSRHRAKYGSSPAVETQAADRVAARPKARAAMKSGCEAGR